MEGKCTIYFEDPFWVGVFEHLDDSGYALAKVVFGGEPSDAELLQFCKTQFFTLDFNPAERSPLVAEEEVGFKRRQRQIRKQMEQTGIGTYAQRALKAQYENAKETHHQASRQERENESKQKYLKRQAARKEKQKGH
jgi:hypothetical protein